MQMQSTYWLEKVQKMISLYVNALLCTLQHIVTHAMQLSGVNSENWRSWQYAATCTKVHWRTRRSFSAPSLTSKYFAFALVQFPVQNPRPTPTLVYETAGRFLRAPLCIWRRIQILIMQSSPLLGPNIFLSTLFSNTLS